MHTIMYIHTTLYMYSITLHALYSLYHDVLHDLGVQSLCTLMMEM